MIVVMKTNATREQIDHMLRRVREMGLTPHMIEGTERKVIACVGDERFKAPEQLAVGAGVDKVIPILARYKIASREVKPEPTIIPLGLGSLGGPRIGIIAGPCTVELSYDGGTEMLVARILCWGALLAGFVWIYRRSRST